MKDTQQSTKKTNKHQHMLIILISTLDYLNSNFKQYNQNKILYYFNRNLRQNGQKEIKMKTLQSYLYKLGKTINVTENYHKHLGENCGTEVYYKLKYPKKICNRRINKFFREKKEERFQKRVNKHYENLEKAVNQHSNEKHSNEKHGNGKYGSAKTWECFNNNIIINNKEK
ncbi:plasmid maintenance protein, partial [Borrelia persica]|uniref:plasmid maintenance protein n=1 Tax=Borrelia persica TaxID=44448 RepID=UPI000464EA26